MDFAIIKTGGKQYKVSLGQKIKIEKISGDKDAKAVFGDVLLAAQGGKISIGQPLVKNVKVQAKVLAQGKAKKIVVLKYKAKKRYSIKRGHRQPFSQVEITDIKLGS